jgi:hypothetical protein
MNSLRKLIVKIENVVLPANVQMDIKEEFFHLLSFLLSVFGVILPLGFGLSMYFFHSPGTRSLACCAFILVTITPLYFVILPRYFSYRMVMGIEPRQRNA